MQASGRQPHSEESEDPVRGGGSLSSTRLPPQAHGLLRTRRWQQTFCRWDTLRAWQLGRLQLLENMTGFTSTAKHPVTFLCLECNLSLEALLENLNLVSHQLFIIREAYV